MRFSHLISLKCPLHPISQNQNYTTVSRHSEKSKMTYNLFDLAFYSLPILTGLQSRDFLLFFKLTLIIVTSDFQSYCLLCHKHPASQIFVWLVPSGSNVTLESLSIIIQFEVVLHHICCSNSMYQYLKIQGSFLCFLSIYRKLQGIECPAKSLLSYLMKVFRGREFQAWLGNSAMSSRTQNRVFVLCHLDPCGLS